MRLIPPGSAASKHDSGDEKEPTLDGNRPSRTRIWRQASGKTGHRAPDAPALRFSDSEWKEIKAAAERHDVPVAEFVREIEESLITSNRPWIRGSGSNWT